MNDIPCRVCGKPATMGAGDFDTMVCSLDCTLIMSVPPMASLWQRIKRWLGKGK